MKEIAMFDNVLLLEEKGKYYLQYDAGMFTIVYKRLAITNEEAKSILQNPDLINDIVLDYQDRGEYGDMVR